MWKQKYYTIDDKRQVAPKNIILVCLALYTVWQMGIVFYTNATLSFYGKSPVPTNATTIAVIMFASYVVSIIINLIFMKYSMVIGRAVVALALFSTIMMFMPLANDAILVFYYVNCFCCVFLIGTLYTIEVSILQNKTELKFVLMGSAISFFVIAILQGELFTVPYLALNIISALILIALLFVLTVLPSKIEVKTIKILELTKANRVPRVLIAGTLTAVIISTVSLVFGSTCAETIPHGIGIFYASGGVAAVLVAFLIKKYNFSPFKVYIYSFALTAIGFVFAALSIIYPAFVLPAIILVGFSSLPANMVGFFINTLFSFSPTRFLSQSIVAIGMIVAVIQALLLESLRENIILLFTIMSVLSIIMLVFYVVIESNLSHHWNTLFSKKTPQPITQDLIAETTIEPNIVEVKETPAELPTTNHTSSPLECLSPRERELVSFILSGYTTGEIAKHMYLSENTVKSYRKEIYSKLYIHSRRELFEIATNEKTVNL